MGTASTFSSYAPRGQRHEAVHIKQQASEGQQQQASHLLALVPTLGDEKGVACIPQDKSTRV